MNACDRLLLNANTINKNGEQIDRAAIAICDGIIIWSGFIDDLPERLQRGAKVTEDCSGALITPGLIDCHTHLVYAGSRAEEFKLKLNGASYAEIAQKGGGILSTVRETRLASEDELISQSLPRIQAMLAEGVLTVEIKSGYGLDLETELKMLRVAKKLGELAGVRVKTTFLGAHALPPEYQGKRQEYIQMICQEMLPAVAELKLADAVDVFCESIGFSLAETETVFQKARDLSLPIKCHAEQLSNMGASSLAASYGALSTDHLEYLDEVGIQAMATAGVTAVLLPGAFYFLKETQKPPVTALREAGVGIAVATDCNPGSSPTTSLRLMMNMACQFFGMTVSEVLSGVTFQAAKALGISDTLGSIAPGQHADLLRWPVQDASELCYSFGYPLKPEIMRAGLWV